MNLAEYVDQAPGRQTAIAIAIDCQPQLVWQWSRDKRRIPADRCPSIEMATGGLVSCEEMRPDTQWVRVKDKQWPNPKGRPLLDVAKQKAEV